MIICQKEYSKKKNIEISKFIKSYLSNSFGPNGQDKLFLNSIREIIITNDGATILKESKIKNSIGKIMIDLALSQEEIIGDGTTSVVLLGIIY
jgi:chaperonin GroEL (HSP60 family)